MTEAEWLASSDPHAMLASLAEAAGGGWREPEDRQPLRVSLDEMGQGGILPCICCRTRCGQRDGLCGAYRKLRLFASACCRRVLPLLPESVGLLAVEAVEQYADGALVESACAQAAKAFERRRRKRFPKSPRPHHGVWSAVYSASHLGWMAHSDENYAQDRWQLAATVAQDAARSAGPGEPGVQAALLRDVLGNPFRPLALAPACRTPDVPGLAAAAYEERFLPSGELDPTRLAVLADALEDTGCANAAILDHLRGPGPHVRGCWALDLARSVA